MSTTTIDRVQVGALLDLENLLHRGRQASGAVVRTQFLAVVAVLRELGEVRAAVGCCDWWLAKLLTPCVGASGVRVFPGPPGRNRADAELLRRVRDVPGSVDALVLGSGDAIFTALVAEQARAGRRTVVLGRPGAVAASLRRVAHRVIELPFTEIDLDQAA